MKRILAILAVLLTSVVCLTGCGIVVDIGTTIEKDGSGEIKVLAMLDEELYNALKEDSEYGDYGDYGNIIYKGKQYFGQETSYQFANPEELEYILTETLSSGDDGDGNLGPVFTDLKITKTGLTGTIAEDVLQFGSEDEEYLEYMTIDTYITFTFPYEVIDTNGEVSDDKMTVSWEAPHNEELNVYVKTKGPLSILVIIISILGILLIAAAIVWLVLKKRKERKVIRDQALEHDAQESVRIRYCTACGSPVSPTATFCTHCGSRIN